jgi:nucleotide-binding universal stress UspA family protein
MLKIHKILFPTDFSACAEAAFSHAVHLAAEYGAELHVLNINPAENPQPNDPMGFLDLEADAQNPLLLTDEQTMHTKKAGDDVLVIHAQQQGSAPGKGILDYERQHDIDLIVMGTHGRRGLDRLMLGSTAEEVVRLAAAPVLTVRSAEADSPKPAVRRILVPVDFSEFSPLAVTYTKELALAYGACLNVLHVLDETTGTLTFVPEAKSGFVTASDELARRAQHALSDLIDQTREAGIKAETFLIPGFAASEIVRFAAAHNADLIVIASHGRTGLSRWLLGSVAEKVVRTAPCPTFTIKSFGKSLLFADDLNHAEVKAETS